MEPAKKINKIPIADLRPGRADSFIWLSAAAFWLFIGFCLIVTDFLTQKSVDLRMGSDAGGALLILFSVNIAIPHLRYLLGVPAYRLSSEGLTDWRRFPWQAQVFIPWTTVADVQIQPMLHTRGVIALWILNGSPTAVRSQNVVLILNQSIAGSDRYLIDHVRLCRTEFRTHDLLREYMRRANIRDWPEWLREPELNAVSRNLDGYCFVALGAFVIFVAVKIFFNGKVAMPIFLFLILMSGLGLIVGGIRKLRKPNGTKALDEELGFRN